MAKRGRTPSLIGGTHGTVTFRVAGKKTECRRCKETMPLTPSGADGASATALQPPPHLLTTLPGQLGADGASAPMRTSRWATMNERSLPSSSPTGARLTLC